MKRIFFILSAALLSLCALNLSATEKSELGSDLEIILVKAESSIAIIEKEIANSLEQEIATAKIGEMVMTRLKNIDDVSYIRFASVYRKFTDTTHFVDFIKEFENLIHKEESK